MADELDFLEQQAADAAGSVETSEETQEETSTETQQEETTETQTETTTDTTEESESDTRPFWEQNGFESQDALKERYETLIAKEAEYTEKSGQYEQDKSTWLANEKELRDNLQKEQDNQNLYIADETLARLSILKNKEDKSEYEFYKDIVLDGSNDPKKILGLELSKRYPDLSKEEIEQTIEDKYGLSVEQPDEFVDDAEEAKWNRRNRIKQMDMSDAAKKVVDGYIDDFNKIELPSKRPLSQEELTLGMVNAKKEWSPVLDSVTKAAGLIKTEIKLGDENVPFEVSLTDAEVSEYSKQLNDHVYNNSIPLNDDTKKQLMSNLRDVITLKKIPEIMASVAEKASHYYDDKYSKFWEEKMTNPSGSRMRDIENSERESTNGLEDLMKVLD